MAGSSPPTPLYLPHSLDFPITIQRIHRQQGTSVKKLDKLFNYTVIAPVEGGKAGEVERQVRVWECPIEGDIVTWHIKEGEKLTNASDPFVTVQEPCTHDVQLHGMCAWCGKDLSGTDYLGFSDTSRANISMVHDVGELKVSLEEAKRLEQQTTKRLLGAKKLSLIVDLDQTIIQAAVEDTVGRWLSDPSNSNFSALSGTQAFTLGETITEDGTHRPVMYYIKPRHGLAEFLKNVAEKYEMHVYTMGTRGYASEVCKIVDPDGSFFGGRILSRDENGSITHKSLQRLFPCETNMVVIIDDRADVWDGSPNLLKVIPFDFFPNIGDINSGFLPKKKELAPPPTAKSTKADPDAPAPAASTSTASADTSTTVSDLLVTPSTASEEAVISPSMDEAQKSAAATIHDQLEDRPLSRAEANANSKVEETTPSTSSSSEAGGDAPVKEEEMQEKAVVHDDDRELDRLGPLLDTVHEEFFANPEQGDVSRIIPRIKKRSLEGVTLVLSGLVPLGTRPQDSEYWRLATTFGANCAVELHSKVTHVVANQGGTAKVHQARKMKGVKVVHERWLVNSAAHWMRLPEEDYPVEDPVAPIPAVNLKVEGSSSNSSSSIKMETSPELVLTSGQNDSLAVDFPAEATLPDGDDTDEESVGGDLDLADVGWADANKEIEDALNETDEDDDGGSGTDGESTAGEEDETTDGESATGPAAPRRKRTRVNTNGDSDDDAAQASPPKRPTPAAKAESAAAALPAGSPLQKRVKNSRSRRSRLKVSLTAGEEGDDEQDDDDALSQASSRAPSPLPPSPAKPTVAALAGGGISVAEDGTVDGSSSLDSDDEAFFASMAAEVEMGFQQ